MVEPVGGTCAGVGSGFQEVVGGGVEQPSDVGDGVGAAGAGQPGGQAGPHPVGWQAGTIGVVQRAQQVLDPVAVLAESVQVILHGGGDGSGELIPALLADVDNGAAADQTDRGEAAIRNDG
jgi:hypothetical protein